MLYTDSTYIISNANIIIDAKETISNSSVFVENGIIQSINKNIPQKSTNIPIIDAKGNYLGPGLIDMHIHGCGGVDTTEANTGSDKENIEVMESKLSKMKNFLCEQGITSFQAAIVPSTQALYQIQGALQLSSAKRWESSFLGVYTEGPFINEVKKGGISVESIKSYTTETLENFLSFTRNKDTKLISCMTIAPEMVDSTEIYSILKDNKVKAAWGHSNAFLDEIQKIKDIHITHLFNAMTPLDHKRLGLAGLPFMKDFNDATFELICDTVHVCKEMLELVFSNLGAKNVCLISDAMSQAGMSPGEFNYLGKVAVNDGTCCRIKEDGLLIGSACLISKTGQQLYKMGLIGFNEFFQIAALNPARALNLQDRGIIQVGKRADLIIVDSKLNVLDVFTA